MLKSEAIKALEIKAVQACQAKYPCMPPSHYINTNKYSDRTANNLTKCVIDWLKLNNHQAERISVTGRYIDNSQIVTNCIGQTKRIGSGKWIKPSMQAGTADISATIGGMSVKIEIKIGKDRQSEVQKQYQYEVERSGGVYLIVGDFQSFYDWYYMFIATPSIKECLNNTFARLEYVKHDHKRKGFNQNYSQSLKK